MVGACNIKTEACSYIVKNKNHSVIIAELTNSLPIFLCCTLVILKVTVVIRLRDKTCNIAVASVISLLKRINIKPRNYNIVCNLFGKNTRIVFLLRPLEIAVIIALKEEHLFLACMSSCAHNGKCCCIRAVLHKESPVCTCNSIFKKLCALNHLI